MPVDMESSVAEIGLPFPDPFVVFATIKTTDVPVFAVRLTPPFVSPELLAIPQMWSSKYGWLLGHKCSLRFCCGESVHCGVLHAADGGVLLSSNRDSVIAHFDTTRETVCLCEYDGIRELRLEFVGNRQCPCIARELQESKISVQQIKETDDSTRWPMFDNPANARPAGGSSSGESQHLGQTTVRLDVVGPHQGVMVNPIYDVPPQGTNRDLCMNPGGSERSPARTCSIIIPMFTHNRLTIPPRFARGHNFMLGLQQRCVLFTPSGKNFPCSFACTIETINGRSRIKCGIGGGFKRFYDAMGLKPGTILKLTLRGGERHRNCYEFDTTVGED